MRNALLAAALACVSMAPRVLPQKLATAPANALQMSIAPDQPPSASHQVTQFTITFTNRSQKILSFAPGTTILCGRRPSKTSNVVLNLTDSKGKVHHNMPYQGDGPPYTGSCGGQIEGFIVVLHPHESVSLPLELSKYFDLTDAKQYEMARFPSGTYLLEAEFTSSAFPLPNHEISWEGTVKSNTIQVQFNSEFAAGLDDYPR